MTHRIRRVPNKPLRREQGGDLALDLWLQREGSFVADLPLLLTAAEAELLHAQLCYALDDQLAAPLPDGVPDCRRPGRADDGRAGV